MTNRRKEDLVTITNVKIIQSVTFKMPLVL